MAKEPRTKVSLPVNTTVILALIVIAGFLDVIDFSIVQVALPTIRAEFAVSLADSQWIVAAYGLTLAGFLMLSGRAGDIYGRKKLFLIGLVIFTSSSLAGGLAPSEFILVAARAVQGIGAAISSAIAFSILVATFPEGKARNRALGIFTAVLSAGFATGSILGGFLTSAFGWRSVLFVNVPIGVAAILLSMYFLNEGAKAGAAQKHLDIPGAITITAGLLLFVYSLTNASSNGLFSQSAIIPLALSILLLAGFVVIETRSKAPLIQFSFFRRGAILHANVIGILLSAAATGMIFLLTIYLQQTLGYSPLDAGLSFLPAAIIFFVVGGWVSSALVNRFGVKRVLVASMTMITIGFGVLSQVSVGEGYLGVLAGMVIFSLGASVSFTALNIAGLAGTKHGEEGLASGILNTSQRIGGPIGLAVLVTIASWQTNVLLGKGVASSAATVGGFQYAFITATALSALGILVALMISSKMPVPPMKEMMLEEGLADMGMGITSPVVEE